MELYNYLFVDYKRVMGLFSFLETKKFHIGYKTLHYNFPKKKLDKDYLFHFMICIFHFHSHFFIDNFEPPSTFASNIPTILFRNASFPS